MIPKGFKLIDNLSSEEKERYLREKGLKKAEKSNAQKVLRRFTNNIKDIGFARTKPAFWVREKDYWVEVIHIHKYSFGPCFRIETCIRAYNCSLDFIALQGPIDRALAGDIAFDYEQNNESIEACANKMSAFVSGYSEVWYKKWEKPSSLLGDESPLKEQQKFELKQAILGKENPTWVSKTKELLKIV